METSEVAGRKAPAGPHVGVAVFCVKVDRHPDGSVDFIGAIDSVNLASQFSPPVIDGVLRINVGLLMRPGTLKGPYALTVKGRDPDGNENAVVSQVIEFASTNTPLILSIPLEVSVRGLGVYWFEVTIDHRVITRMSLDIRRVSTLEDEPPRKREQERQR